VFIVKLKVKEDRFRCCNQIDEKTHHTVFIKNRGQGEHILGKQPKGMLKDE